MFAHRTGGRALGAEARLRNSAAGYAERPAWRPQTKFETRGLKLGHGVWELLYTRTDDPLPAPDVHD